MKYEELLKCDGRKFRAVIDGVECEGKITVENGWIYLCQNKCNGVDCMDKKGYDYSWGYMSSTSLSGRVTNFQLINDYPKVMLVSDVEGVDGKPRVVFMEKNGKYLAWSGAKTIEEAESEMDIIFWNYATDIEKPSPLEKELKELIKKIAELSERIKKGER